MVCFQNRIEAGIILADKLLHSLKQGTKGGKKEKPLVLAIPRGGVPVAYEVAKKLQADLDLLIVKKIGTPENPELAIGAVSEEGTPWLNSKIINHFNIKNADIQAMVEKKLEEVQSQVRRLRGSRPAIPVEGRVLIIVDDGIATGATLRAAIHLLRERQPEKIIIAVPVAPEATLESLRQIADEVVCLETPFPFIAVGDWYQDFSQVSDEEVISLLHGKVVPDEIVGKEMTYYDGTIELKADLQLVANMKGLVVFIHESEGSRHSRGNLQVAEELNKIGFATLVPALLTERESEDRKNIFNMELLIDRLLKVSDAVIPHLAQVHGVHSSLAYFGTGTGAAVALGAAAKSSRDIFAIISHGGRPDLVNKYLRRVKSPTLLMVSEADLEVITLNELAAQRLATVQMVIIIELEAIAEVVEYTADWLLQYAPRPKAPLPPKEHIVRAIEERAQPIHSEGAWYNLIEKLAKSRIVMLGEATHGTAEFYDIRRMISEKLIRDHEFDFIAVEGDWPDSQKLNDYIQGKSSSRTAMDIMHHFQRWPTWMWANDEVAALIEWMQNYKAGFYGLDVYSLFESMDYVQSYIQRISPELAQEMKAAYSCFEPFEKNEKAYAQSLLKFEEGCRREVVENLRKILRLRLADLEVKDGDLFSAQQNARIVKNAEEYYRAMLSGGAESWNIRDQHMMETLELLLNRPFQNRKCIIWAHNSHIGDYHATDMLEEGYVNLGGLARERFGSEQVALVGFGTYQGEVLASSAWDGPETVTPLPAAQENSFESYCHKVSQNLQAPRFYMLFDQDARKTILGTREYGHRAVGVVYHPRFEVHGRNYVPTVMAKRYDAFVFVDQTTALRSIPTLTSIKEFPETWPGGL
ncbi:MAG TPA: erythromycin esterase family protein [Pseudobdellovibrionaceae bacterium]|jgi:erythromycin esterase-like protein/predicted phosphoribosyltransferase